MEDQDEAEETGTPDTEAAALDAKRTRKFTLIGVAGVAAIAAAVAALVLTSDRRSPDEVLKDEAVELCKTSTRNQLKDPASAQFNTLVAVDGPLEEGARVWMVGGQVNAKNGYGGYTGFKTVVCRVTLRDRSSTMTIVAEIMD